MAERGGSAIPPMTTNAAGRRVIVYRASRVRVAFADGYADGFADGIASVPTPDAVAPTITVVSPTPGAPPGAGGFPASYRLAKDTPIILDVTDLAPGLRHVVVVARFYTGSAEGANPDEEVVYRRGQFRGKYVTGSRVEIIANGIRLHVRRRSGWPGGHVVFAVDPIDQAGNLG